MAVDVEASLARQVQIMRAALEKIEARLPALLEESEEVWVNRRWDAEFRDVQRIARAALKTAKGAA